MNLNGQINKPAVLGGTVPVLDIGWNFDDITRMKLIRRLSPFLIVTPASRHQQDLAARMLVPIVAATRLKPKI